MEHSTCGAPQTEITVSAKLHIRPYLRKTILLKKKQTLHLANYKCVWFIDTFFFTSGQFRRTNGVGGSRRSEVNVAIAQVHLPTIEELNSSNKSECSQDQLKSSIRNDIPNQFVESSSV